jgi:hypothetical protein
MELAWLTRLTLKRPCLIVSGLPSRTTRYETSFHLVRSFFGVAFWLAWF